MGRGGETKGNKDGGECNNIPLRFVCKEKVSQRNQSEQKVGHFYIANGDCAAVSESFEHVQHVSMCLSFSLCSPFCARQAEEAIDVKEGGGKGGNGQEPT